VADAPDSIFVTFEPAEDNAGDDSSPSDTTIEVGGVYSVDDLRAAGFQY